MTGDTITLYGEVLKNNTSTKNNRIYDFTNEEFKEKIESMCQLSHEATLNYKEHLDGRSLLLLNDEMFKSIVCSDKYVVIGGVDVLEDIYERAEELGLK